MDSHDYMTELLRRIAAHDGEWTWYQLDRALSVRDLIPMEPLPKLLRELERRGLIRSGPGPNPAQPTYFVTAAGRERLSELDLSSPPKEQAQD
jgi:DNA-binding HxlR family transcriptional regulator